MRLLAIVSSVLVGLLSSAHAAPPEPRGPHPRMLLDPALRTAWKAQADAKRGPVVGAIALCTSGQSDRHDDAVYQGAEWARVLQACLVAWAATDKPEHAATALKFFTALLEDRDRIGDRQGGDHAARRDSGYVIRNIGPYTALAYDWLHDAPGMTPQLRQRARQRWASWLGWYRAEGYRARSPGTNYHAGFLAAATMIAIAQGGEAAEQHGAELWRFVADEMWGKDMATALARGGILDGGDWPEGWQYGPLAVAHYALAARLARRAGIAVAGVEAWLGSVLRRHVYGLSPADRVYVGHDTEVEEPNIAPHVLTLDAIALGDAAPDDRRWALGELARLQLADKHYFLYDALAAVAARPARAPRATWPTWYASVTTGTVFARTRWDERAVWLVAECPRALDADHRHPKAGNFVLSRGKDDLIVDPSPYGSASTLTSNAPTVVSAHLPRNYQPSQGGWAERTRWAWTLQTRSGVIAMRCDYADAYKFQHRATDVGEALRDLVLLPGADGTDAVLLVLDRARTGDEGRSMYLRFRVPGGLALEGETASKQLGATRLTIQGLLRTSGTPSIGRTDRKDCYAPEVDKGRCDAARFEVTDYRLELAGPAPRAVHAIGATAAGTPVATRPLAGAGWAGVAITSPRQATVVWPTRPGAAFGYRARPGTHVILDAPDAAGMATIQARRDGDACAVDVTPGGVTPALPAIVTLDEACAVAVDAASAIAASSLGTRPPTRAQARSPRAGCGDAPPAPGAPIALAVVVLAIARRRRISPRGPARCAR